MSLELSVICENTVGRPVSACGEHGFACLVQTDDGTWLFDTGSGATLLANLDALGHDAQQIKGVILSHGHYDHCTGQIRSAQLYAHFPNKVFFANVGTTVKVD